MLILQLASGTSQDLETRPRTLRRKERLCLLCLSGLIGLYGEKVRATDSSESRNPTGIITTAERWSNWTGPGQAATATPWTRQFTAPGPCPRPYRPLALQGSKFQATVTATTDAHLGCGPNNPIEISVTRLQPLTTISPLSVPITRGQITDFSEGHK